MKNPFRTHVRFVLSRRTEAQDSATEAQDSVAAVAVHVREIEQQ